MDIPWVGMAELVNALDLGSKSWEFKSLYPYLYLSSGAWLNNLKRWGFVAQPADVGANPAALSLASLDPDVFIIFSFFVHEYSILFLLFFYDIFY